MKTLIAPLLALAVYQHWDRVQALLSPPSAGAQSGEVILYATEWCGYCAKARELLAADGISYREIDIEKDSAGRQAYQALGGRGVPLLDVRGQIVRGYNPEAIRAAY